MSDISLSEFSEQNSELEQLREANTRLAQQLRQTKDKVDALVKAAHQGSYDAHLAMGPVDPVDTPSSDARSHSTEVALWHLTDWQGAKLTTTYNSEIMRERVLCFGEKAKRITEIQRADHPIEHGVILFGGDMVEGLFNFPTQPFEIDASIYDQYKNVSRLLVDIVRVALSIYPTVDVYAEWGNHGRIGSKRSAVPKADNFDRMTYFNAQQVLELTDGTERLSWHESSEEDEQRVEIGNYRALLIHGDEVGRTGYASPATIVQHVNKWRGGGYRVNGQQWRFQDCYVGHYHNHAEYALADGIGRVFFTGSTESDNRYARDTMAASAVPSQRLHFIDPEKGRVTAQYRLELE